MARNRVLRIEVTFGIGCNADTIIMVYRHDTGSNIYSPHTYSDKYHVTKQSINRAVNWLSELHLKGKVSVVLTTWGYVIYPKGDH